MSLVAGIVSRRDQALPAQACQRLAESISRDPSDQVKVFSYPSAFFAKVDIGALGEAGFHTDSNGVLSMLTGEPLLASPGIASPPNRLANLITINANTVHNNWDILREAEGTFCTVHYQPHSQTLTLITDKLGVRPLYYWIDEDLIVFSSTLRVLEECPLVPKKMDLRAVTEMVGLGSPLSDRTPYAGVSLLKPAEVLVVSNRKRSRYCYWRWDEIEVSQEPEEMRLASVYEQFQSAVSRRLGNEKSTTAYLSGGLDSRCVVAALSQRNVQLRTVNFARPGTQDHYCGNQFASEIGSFHQSLPKAQGDQAPDYSLLMAKAIEGFTHKSNDGNQDAPERPRVVWSGEGGSCLLGHVHQSSAIIELMRAGDVDGAIDAYLEREQIHVPPKLFRSGVLKDIGDVIKRGIREELAQLHAADPGRNFYLYLAFNDQRRKLAAHFENIDQHRLEFQLPFFDSQFVSSIMATRLDWCLRHKFYVKWISQFPPLVTSVPWQAYPGHEPCPLPVPAQLGYQWDSSYLAKEEASQKHRVIKQAADLLRATDFPHKILNRRNLRLVAWAHARRWRDYKYVIDAAQTYYAYSKKCDGHFVTST